MARSLLVCRGCCCGTDEPDAADERHRRLLDTDIDVSFLNCLGPCGERDLVGLRDEQTTIWLGAVDDAALEAAVTWARSRGAVAPELTSRVLDPAVHAFTPEIEMTLSYRPPHRATLI